MVAPARIWLPPRPAPHGGSYVRSSAYMAKRAAFAAAALTLHAVAARGAEPPPTHAVETIRARYRDLLVQDVRNAEQGRYPWSLLLRAPRGSDLAAAPAVLRDFLTLGGRRDRGEWRLPADTDVDGVPPYYRRQYHWQRGGYLDDRSARIYDLGVELLFVGAADVMRRQVIPPIRDAVWNVERPKILDVGCGTGRTLAQLAVALPNARLTGVDLSPNQIREAARVAGGARHLSLLVEDAARLPFPDGHFDVTTSTYLFHELPPAVRRDVAAELVRVTRPGGALVVQDSLQRGDATGMDPLLDAFGRQMHEPFWSTYLDDRLEDLFAAHPLRSKSDGYLSKTLAWTVS
jgi:ubiquinone/menaquinone biosynthesis C-methylase UbiE